ncbi:unnamed protein product [Paramecium sonneborni]|uniref:Uncharacterized protein n=1 Tax=Paramecium sonneborni TaxID=65129 RepID=A0A8S1RH71_9CILI|nr:unnamed protein product [Paramecium sonneborni]
MDNLIKMPRIREALNLFGSSPEYWLLFQTICQQLRQERQKFKGMFFMCIIKQQQYTIFIIFNQKIIIEFQYNKHIFIVKFRISQISQAIAFNEQVKKAKEKAIIRKLSILMINIQFYKGLTLENNQSSFQISLNQTLIITVMEEIQMNKQSYCKFRPIKRKSCNKIMFKIQLYSILPEKKAIDFMDLLNQQKWLNSKLSKTSINFWYYQTKYNCLINTTANQKIKDKIILKWDYYQK